MALDLQCLARVRVDVVRYYTTVGGWNPNDLSAIFTHWWSLDRAQVPQVSPQSGVPPPPGNDDSSTFDSLASYALFHGCMTVSQPITVPDNTSPGSGGRVVGAPPPGTVQGQFQAAVTWAKNNPLALGAGIAILALVFYRPAPVSFE